ncbi:MAG: sulfite exporter TauE/SafE family protein [Ignavibacteria bacterium]|nr:sulfite exporter TauE/SafE family protein [Ignavibacteria bacterium]
MQNEAILLISTAGFLGFLHTILGPDHYIPFIALSKAKNWSIKQTLLIVFICGVGHVLSSILLGIIGIILGKSALSLVAIEETKGNISGWLLIAFGFIYSIWGLKVIFKEGKHKHFHIHTDGDVHIDHNTVGNTSKVQITPWILFIIFAFGPCEPLIPIIMYPGIEHNFVVAGLASLFFAITTIGTMMLTTFLGVKGINLIQFNRIEKYVHSLAGLTILVCGIGVQFLGL